MGLAAFVAVAIALVVPCGGSHAKNLLGAEPDSKGRTAEGVNDSESGWPQPVNAPRGAPNVLLILLDDVGFGASSTFGGSAQTPELDKLAMQGLRYNRFHTAALCSPTRAALLSGRNDHRMGFGTITDSARGSPGYNGVWKKSTASIAKVLKLNGYSTAAFGKWHNTPFSEITAVGPFDRWPTGLGFEYFYGFMSGAESNWEPVLYRNTSHVAPPKTPSQGYHLTIDLVDDAIRWLHSQDSLAPEKPYFIYFAPGATHSPLHVPKDWITRYQGRFDQGWDVLRKEIFERQKQLGVIPATAQLTPRPKELPSWESFSQDQRRLLARQMEVYAAFLSHTDHEVGRLVRAVQQSPRGDNTLIIYIASDNGASAGAGIAGWPTSSESQLQDLDGLGGEEYFNDYSAGWAWATSSPFQWLKSIASHFGATRAPLVVSWPNRIKDTGGLRGQFAHVNDVAPTIYELSGIQIPESVEGVKQLPMDGTSLAYSFDAPAASTRHRTQIFEQFGNRAIYHDGWMASARHSVPWLRPSTKDFENDPWELYHVAEDFSQANDLAARHPAKLEELKQLFDKEAIRNDIYPLDYGQWKIEPSFTRNRRTFTYYADQAPIQVDGTSLPDFTKSHRIEANVVFPESGAEGAVVSHGGRMSGFALYVLQGHLIYEYKRNFLGSDHKVLKSRVKIPRGSAELVYEFTRDVPMKTNSAGGADGTGRLYINKELVGELRLKDFSPGFWGTFDIGQAAISPVSPAFEVPFKFNGLIEQVRVDMR